MSEAEQPDLLTVEERNVVEYHYAEIERAVLEALRSTARHS